MCFSSCLIFSKTSPSILNFPRIWSRRISKPSLWYHSGTWDHDVCTKRRPYENHAAKELEDYLSLARTFLSYGVHVHSADALPCTSAHINNLIYDYACMPRAMPYTHTRAPLMEYSRPERRRWGRRDRERERKRKRGREREREGEGEREKRGASLHFK